VRRVNIQVRDGVGLAEAMRCVASIVNMGRVSEAAGMKCFCWHAELSDGVHVSALRPDKRRPNSDSFVVHRNVKEEK
jgi:hypothetical protein